MDKSDRVYPAWCCHDCGITASGGKTLHNYATYHSGICGVCGESKAVTEPRDFCYPDFTKVRADRMGARKPEGPGVDAQGQDACPY